MRKHFYFLTTVLVLTSLVACSSSTKKRTAPEKNEETHLEAENGENSSSVTGVIGKAQAAKSIKVSFNSNELISKVSEYIAQNPENSLSQVVSYANSLKNEIGLPFTLVALSAEIVGVETFIKTENGTRLNVGIGSEPLCSAGIAVTYPVLRRDGDIWTVRYSSGEYKIKAAPLRTGDIRREKDGKLETQVPLPEEGLEPGGIDKSGESLFVRFDLNPSASSWWQRVMKRNPKEEKPFLVLEMGESEFEFSSTQDNYDEFDDSPPRETKEDDTYILRFEDSKYFFQSISCG
ncbi:MAG: hypothetical protein AABZ31_10175 [Bdellovibrionota bacterium]